MGVKPELARCPDEASEVRRPGAIEYVGDAVHRDLVTDDQTWTGNCVNRATGDYKGWPIDDGERRAIFG